MIPMPVNRLICKFLGHKDWVFSGFCAGEPHTDMAGEMSYKIIYNYYCPRCLTTRTVIPADESDYGPV